MYDQCEKAQRDYECAISGAREEGMEKGLEKGREEGELIGRVQMIEEILGDAPTPRGDLFAHGPAKLAAKLADLQQRPRDRQV